MCSNEPIPVPPDAYEKMPLAIDSDHPIFNVGKKELTAALRTARDHDWAADWLFRDAVRPFHQDSRPLPPEAFGSSLAVHVHHDISTPGACPSKQTSLLPLRHDTSSQQDSKLIVSKDIDLLLVPMARLADVTAGYAFVRGVSESSMQISETASFGPQSSNQSAINPPAFATARFVFHHPRNDFLMVVSGQSSHMIGIVSIRWLSPESRDRSYFAVPNSDYGAGDLPSRVLSVQCNVDFKVDPSTKKNNAAPDPPNANTSTAQQGTGHESQPQLVSSSSFPAASEQPTVVFPTPRESPLLSPVMSSSTNTDSHDSHDVQETWFNLDDAIPESFSGGLESIGTVLQPEDSDSLLPTFMQDFVSSSMDLELERILSDDGNLSELKEPTLPLPGGSMDNMFSVPTSNPSDSIPDSQRPAGTRSYVSSDVDSSDSIKPSSSASEGQWLVSPGSSTPDGMNATRQPGPSDTSAGAFDLSSLAESLSNIASSLSGDFFGPRVRKDVMDPMTGELISRCTGELTGFVRKIDNGTVSILQQFAAQTYYSSQLPVAPDNRLVVTGPPPVTGARTRENQKSLLKPTSTTSLGTAATGVIPKIQQGTAFKRVRQAPRLAPLAPRQLPLAAAPRAPPALPTARSTQVDDSRNDATWLDNSSKSGKDKSREARLEAKRIKNRMSAAKSNQKRRLQLEKQKEELDSLRKRVDELQDKKKTITEENARLKAMMTSET